MFQLVKQVNSVPGSRKFRLIRKPKLQTRRKSHNKTYMKTVQICLSLELYYMILIWC